MSAESKFATSQSVRRVEDNRFLTGRGRYVEDVRMPGMLRAFVLRSPVGHADITDLDVSAAKAHPGVHLVLTAADLDAAPGVKNDMEGGQIANRDGTMSARPPRPILAVDRVRYVGEPVACIVADTLA
ncbi:MAG: xanthine dehydrogenase family protein molybdopterin-binding subunit, partial [Pseudomonadota bacterium]